MAMLLRTRDDMIVSGPSLVGRETPWISSSDAGRQHHARVSPDGTAWQFEDLGSRNGSSINGRRRPGSQPLSEDILILGTPDERWEVH